MNLLLRIFLMGAISCVSMHALATAPSPTLPQIPPILEEDALKPEVSPCDDFYQFACGGWIDKTVIPSDKHSVNRVMTPLSDTVDASLNKIILSDVDGTNPNPATYAKKMADDYMSCVNADQNAAAMRDLLNKKIAEIHSSIGNLPALIAHMHLEGSDVLFGFGSSQDPTNSDQVIGDAGQGGMSFHDPDYYFNPSAKSEEIRVNYVKTIATFFGLTGQTPDVSRKIAQDVFAFEKNLATKAFSITDQSDPAKTTFLVGTTGLKKMAPHFDWDLYFKTLGTDPKQVNVNEPPFFQHLDEMLVSAAPSDLEHYLQWQLINRSASKMGGDFEKAHFEFWDAYMNGAKVMKARWQLCTQSVEGGLGYALAEAYAKTLDAAAIKTKTDTMIDQIKSAFADELKKISTGVGAWMDGATMSQALEKVRAVNQKVGAPDKFRNYDSLTTTRTSYLQNSYAIAVFESLRDVKKINLPVDRTEWNMMPWEINAYYDRSNNEFVFPFGILQPPSLDLTASDGANMGSFGGGTIGHELTHGFDNNGSKYDSHGNLKSWWTPKTRQAFDQKSQCYVKQADAYKIAAVGMSVRGEQTLEENMADQGGVKLGEVALEKILTTRKPAANWLKYNERQQYWIAYAQGWCSKYTTENLRSNMTLDVHPPAEFRVNAVVMNRPEFALDFACKKNARMNPVKKCELW